MSIDMNVAYLNSSGSSSGLDEIVVKNKFPDLNQKEHFLAPYEERLLLVNYTGNNGEEYSLKGYLIKSNDMSVSIQCVSEDYNDQECRGNSNTVEVIHFESKHYRIQEIYSEMGKRLFYADHEMLDKALSPKNQHEIYGPINNRDFKTGIALPDVDPNFGPHKIGLW